MLTLTGAGESMPLMVTALDVMVELSATSSWSTKLKTLGVVSGTAAAAVVEVNVPCTPPMVSVVTVSVSG